MSGIRRIENDMVAEIFYYMGDIAILIEPTFLIVIRGFMVFFWLVAIWGALNS